LPLRNLVHRGLSSDKGRQWLLAEERTHQMREELKRAPLPRPASSGDCEDSFGEALAVAGLITGADFHGSI
jgi:hypothetical protein